MIRTILLLLGLAVTGQTQMPADEYHRRGTVTESLGRGRFRVRPWGMEGTAVVELPIICPPEWASDKMEEASRMVVGTHVEASELLMSGKKITSDLSVLTVTKVDTMRDHRLVQEQQVTPRGVTIVEVFVANGLIVSPGEAYDPFWRSAMHAGRGFWHRDRLPRNTWIVPHGAEAEVQRWWDGGGK